MICYRDEIPRIGRVNAPYNDDLRLLEKEVNPANVARWWARSRQRLREFQGLSESQQLLQSLANKQGPVVDACRDLTGFNLTKMVRKNDFDRA